MSLYNLLFGRNPNSEVVLGILGLKECDVERFRNCGMNQEGISIYTRTGGGNREDYPNLLLTSHPCYLSDEDDDFDRTYATFYFRFPEDIAEDCLKFLDVSKNGVPASIINRVVETLSREKTPNDLFRECWDAQRSLTADLLKSGHIITSNGTTIVPLSDYGMERLLKSCETHGVPGHEGEFLPYWIAPYKIQIIQDSKDYSGEPVRAQIQFKTPWEIDQKIWEHWIEKFGETYPKAIGAIKDHYDTKLKTV